MSVWTGSGDKARFRRLAGGAVIRFAFAVLLGGLAAAGPAAADSAPELLAERAEAIQAAHCSTAAGGSATRAAEALAAVSATLAEVSRGYDTSEAVYLLYWRGVLHECLNQTERARADLVAFVERVGPDLTYADLVRQAKRRLGRGDRESEGSTATLAPGPLAGVALLGGGGALAGFAAGSAAQAQRGQTLWDAGMRPYEETAQVGVDAERLVVASRVMVGGAAASGLAGAVVLAVSGVRRSASVTALAAPLPGGGLAVVVGGRW